VTNSSLDYDSATGPVAITMPPRTVGSLRARLRQATLESHERIDLAVSKLHLQHRADYGAFLNLHYSMLRFLQPSWRSEDEADFRSLTACLNADLQAIGVTGSLLPLPPPLPRMTPAGSIGLAYVIRGSRLGSKFLRHRIPADFASSFLDCPVTLAWPAFLRQLEEFSLAVEPQVQVEAIEGARKTFEFFL
jgi:heme oxygenase